MSVGETLRDLGKFLDECESEGTVTSVDLTEGNDGSGSGPLTAEVQVELSPGDRGELSLAESRVDSGGGLRLAFESSTPVVPLADHDVDVEVTGTTMRSDGCIEASLSASVTVDGEKTTDGEPDSEEVAAPEGATSSGGSAGRDVPPFRDPELLSEVYASCDTFAEMTDEIGMDVTAETVRRYMIDHGIHEPNSYDTDGRAEGDATAGESGGESPEESDGPEDGGPQQVVLADGIGLPDDVTVETLIETVKRSNTIFEVKQDIGVERQDALEMLRELNLLDLVVGRLATEADRDISREEVVERLREASATR